VDAVFLEAITLLHLTRVRVSPHIYFLPIGL